jgi:hypothetical protein
MERVVVKPRFVLTSNGYRLDESPKRLGELTPTPDAELTDRTALRRRLARDGYLWLRGALDPDLVHGFRQYYLERMTPTGVWEGPGDRARMRQVLFGEIVPGPEYQEFCAQPAILEWYRWFLGGEPHLHRRKIIRHVKPGEQGIGLATQAHYDLVYLRDGTDQVLSSWIPLGDCPVQRGGLVYLEGSHHHYRARDGARSHPAASITADLPGLADELDTRWLVADYKAGDMMVHTAYTVHAALDNVDTEVRLSTDIRYQRVDLPVDERWQNDWHSEDGL